jgi:hypothetical protein
MLQIKLAGQHVKGIAGGENKQQLTHPLAWLIDMSHATAAAAGLRCCYVTI